MSPAQSSTSNLAEAIASGEEELGDDASPGQTSMINLAEVIASDGVQNFQGMTS